ncbi:MAG: beta-galactosidase [Herpetosiphonaceae bacterium]|nr:beta-galactosidase [Herpetosiphonaceae bacterium]
MTIPRPDYPRPQFVRPDWMCLNGTWQFEIDAGDSGYERGVHERDLATEITVPFCPEATLSGIGNVDFMAAVWYRRTVTIPEEWGGRRVLLHFAAVDYDTTVWVNGIEVVRHRGGFSPFTCELDGIAGPGDTATIVVRARDDNRPSQPRGKQSATYQNEACNYTRTTGIWQTVWMEPVGRYALRRPRITPDVANSMFRLEQPITQNASGLRLRASLRAGTAVIAVAECRADLDLAPRLDLHIPADRRRLWSPSDPYLYDLEIELVDSTGQVVDRATSYAGLRSVAIQERQVKINGEVIFQRLVLDQGYYADGIMTAPSDADLVRDIELSMAAGFNGARLHQKVFEERYLYHADRLGYLVWGEFADWGASGFGAMHDHQQPGVTYVAQWLEALERDYSHPSIIGWCPLNETWQWLRDRITVLDDATRAMFLATKAMDTSRPVLDTSGYAHRVPESDIYDSHDYIQDIDFRVGLEKFKQRHAGLPEGKPYLNPDPERMIKQWPGQGPIIWSIPYRGQPYFVSEFGGFKWNPNAEIKSAEENLQERTTSWGYGADPASADEVCARFEAVCDILLDNPHMFGYCYTQLTDVFQEENGIFFFDRTPKFDLERIRAIQQRPAAIEQQAAR